VTVAPVAVRGPDYVLDDWFTLANGHFDGRWHALPADLARARPGSAAVYAVVFGVVGRHPLVALVLQTALAAVVAVQLRALAARFLPPATALLLAALWVVLPNHSSLLYWATGSALAAALLLLLLGCRALTGGRDVAGALLCAASVLTYEATAPMAAVAVVAVPLLAGRAWRRPLAIGAAVLVPTGAWVVAAIPSVKRGLHETAALGQLLPAHVGWGVLPRGPVATAFGLAACVVATLALVEAGRRRRFDVDSALLVTGAAVIVLGTLPFVRYFYGPLGFGDRVNVVAAVGTAMVWTGLFGWTARHVPRALAAVAAGAVVLGFAVAAWQSADAWADAQDDAARVLASIRPVHAGDRVVVPRSTMRRNVAAFLDDSNWAGAVQLEAGTRDVEAFLGPEVRPVAGATPGG
jgi:hypothetical protein